MKHARTHTAARLTALLTVLLFSLSLFSCREPFQSGGNGNVTIVLQGESAVEYTVDLSEVEQPGSLRSVLDHLRTEKGLTYQMTGTFLDAIGTLSPNPEKHEYIAVYTSVERDFDVSEWGSTVEYDGRTLNSAGVGILEMSVTDGAVILFTIAVY